MTLPVPQFWRGRRVLITGHTGFKGGWLSVWLAHLGAQVTGYALPPEHGDGIFAASGVSQAMTSVTGDVKDRSRLRHCIELMRPDVIFHLAAQSLVRRAHSDPSATYLTNVVGTSEVLEAARVFPLVHSVIVVTSDKVYENREDNRSFRETHRLGGIEPYGVSKAAAEMVTAAFRHSLARDDLAVASARAGNVIGGGDWGEDRLVPDAIRAFRSGTPLEVRNPDSVRPWQHVLDPLCGYLVLAERLSTRDTRWRGAWNFGAEAAETVQHVADLMVERWNAADLNHATWHPAPQPDAPYEAKLLRLDSAHAHDLLGWQPRLALPDAIAWTMDWYALQARGEAMFGPSVSMIDAYMERDPA